MTPDPRWLEILKASGWQTTASTAACGLFLLVVRLGWLPPLNPWVIPSVTFGFLLCGCLALASVASEAFKSFSIHIWIQRRLDIQKEKRALRNYLPHITPDEHRIISYLLAKNQKMFTTVANGGYAATLLSRRIVVCCLQPPQYFDPCNMPMAIPDHLWDVFSKHKDQFPYEPPKPGETEDEPWRVTWVPQ
jgi:hypothetical protein